MSITKDTAFDPESNPNLWERIKLFLRVLMMTRFSLLLALVAIVVAITDQGQDVLRAMGESPDPIRYSALVIATMLCAFSAWYCARAIYRFRFSDPASSVCWFPRFKKHYPRLLGAAVILLIMCALLSASLEWGSLVLAGILLVCMIAFLSFVYNRRKWTGMKSYNEEKKNIGSLHELFRQHPKTGWVFLGLILLNITLFFAFLYLPPGLDAALGTLPITLIAGATLIPVGSLLVYLGMRGRFPSVILIFVLAIVFSRFNDNHLVRLHSEMTSYAKSQLLAQDQERALAQYPSFVSYYRGWIDDLKMLRAQNPAYGKSEQQPIPVFLVAAEGGGIRAAYWTAAVLAELQDRALSITPDGGPHLNFARHVFAISGVSGGSLGAAVFAALLGTDWKNPEACNAACDGSYKCRAREVLSQDYLAPTVAALLFPDLMQRFLPVPVVSDRAMALEQAWERGWQRCELTSTFSKPFDELWRDSPYTTPLLFLNSTVVETGQRLIVNPIVFPTEAEGIKDTEMTAGNRFEDIFSDALDSGVVLGSSLPLSTAALLSARFTYVSPAGTIRRQDKSEGEAFSWIRAVDGGYFENSGAVTTAEILLAIRRAAVQQKDNIRPIIIHISNDPRPLDGKETGPSEQRVSLGEILSPARALLKTRSARGYQARDALRERIRSFAEGGAYLHFQLCEFDTKLPLGWSLSIAAQNDMDQQLTGAPKNDGRTDNVVNLDRVIKLLQGDSSAAGVGEPATCQL